MTPEEILISWLRKAPGRQLMSDSDGTLKAIYTTGFMRVATSVDGLAQQIKVEPPAVRILSDCCSADVRLGGKTTKFYVCTKCEKACDVA